MAIVQPETFVFTDAETDAVQSANMAHQAGVARRNPAQLALSIGVPVLLVAVLIAVDWLWYGGAMPMPLFVAFMAVFAAGMFTQLLATKLTFDMSRRHLRQATRQTFAPRTVRLTDEGIELALPEARSLYAWSGIDRAEQTGGLILIWAGHVMVAALPARAFASDADAQAFLAECRSRAADGAPAASA
jgi:hypothetical protein